MNAAAAVSALAAAPASAGGHPASHLVRLALADFRERTRRPAFFVSLAVIAWITHGMLPPQGSGYRTFVMSDNWRPAYGPEWVGALVGLLMSLYLLLVGFYLVKGSVERDRRTGVGQVLAAARVSRLRYVAGKALSNFLVLASMLAVAFVMALVAQQLLGEVRRFDPLATALPLALIGLPVAALVAAGAVLIECVPGLAGGFGNVVWFVASMTLVSVGAIESDRGTATALDLVGGGTVAQSTYEALRAAHPEVPIDRKSLSVGVNVSPRYRGARLGTFTWPGLRWDAAMVGGRLLWVLVALVLLAPAALVFDRFERPARAPSRAGARVWERLRRAAPAPAHAAIGSAAHLAPAVRGAGFAGLVRAELALLLHGQPLLWYLGALGLGIACAFAPLGAVRAALLPILSVWPVLVLGSLGARERLHGTESLLFSVARPVGRLLAAGAVAGALLYVALGAPALLRLAAAGEWGYAGGWLLGSAFVPLLALALGTWTGGAKFFEVLVLFAWYMGPMHHIAELDYTGVTAPRSPQLWAAYAALAAGLAVAAWFGRSRRLQN